LPILPTPGVAFCYTFADLTRIKRTLELSFKNPTIRMVCENEDKAKEVLGVTTAFGLKSRLADMRAAKFVAELVAGSPGEINHGGIPAYKLELTAHERIIFCSVHENTPMLVNGKIDWHQVSRVQLITIGS
jgi:hypothetical protein